jgi:hypothetical protein
MPSKLFEKLLHYLGEYTWLIEHAEADEPEEFEAIKQKLTAYYETDEFLDRLLLNDPCRLYYRLKLKLL